MGEFVTSRSRIEQVDKPGYFKTLDNELFLDDDGELYIVPRYFWSDGYTFPRLVMLLLGDKNKYDIRPCHGHDLYCRFHQCIRVKTSLTLLKMLGIVHSRDELFVCEDIPTKYLDIKPINKLQANNLFYRMMTACKINIIKRILIRFGVIFNFNWFRTGKKSLETYDIYHEDIGLVNGF